MRRSSDPLWEINFRRLMAIGKLMDDEDCDFLDEVASEGVSLGVDEEMPGVPSVFEEKLNKWAREFVDEGIRQVWSENYSSAEGGKLDIWRQVDEEVAKGTIRSFQKRKLTEVWRPASSSRSWGSTEETEGAAHS